MLFAHAPCPPGIRGTGRTRNKIPSRFSAPTGSKRAVEGLDYCKCNSSNHDMWTYLFPVPLGSIPELPADSCTEIKASEGGQAVSGNYWLDSTRSGNSLLARCDMKTARKWN